MSARTLTVRAHAKVNLDLRVLETRRDGFHDLRTVFQSLELHDTITVTARRGPFALRCRQPDVPRDDTNLAWRAARALWGTLGRDGEPRDVSVTIVKQIPVCAGLGGGSTDAAATLRALACLWHVSARPRLHELAASLGADVPFFLWGGTALGLGRGDVVYPLVDLPQYWVVLVLPQAGVKTVEAYAWYDEDREGSEMRRRRQASPVVWPVQEADMVNDLEGPVVRRIPEIGAAQSALLAAGAVGSAVSGSGSAVFGLFLRRPDAQAARRALARSGWRAILTRTSPRDEYARRSRVAIDPGVRRRQAARSVRARR